MEEESEREWEEQKRRFFDQVKNFKRAYSAMGNAIDQLHKQRKQRRKRMKENGDKGSEWEEDDKLWRRSRVLRNNLIQIWKTVKKILGHEQIHFEPRKFIEGDDKVIEIDVTPGKKKKTKYNLRNRSRSRSKSPSCDDLVFYVDMDDSDNDEPCNNDDDAGIELNSGESGSASLFGEKDSSRRAQPFEKKLQNVAQSKSKCVSNEIDEPKLFKLEETESATTVHLKPSTRIDDATSGQKKVMVVNFLRNVNNIFQLKTVPNPAAQVKLVPIKIDTDTKQMEENNVTPVPCVNGSDSNPVINTQDKSHSGTAIESSVIQTPLVKLEDKSFRKNYKSFDSTPVVDVPALTSASVITTEQQGSLTNLNDTPVDVPGAQSTTKSQAEIRLNKKYPDIDSTPEPNLKVSCLTSTSEDGEQSSTLKDLKKENVKEPVSIPPTMDSSVDLTATISVPIDENIFNRSDPSSPKLDSPCSPPTVSSEQLPTFDEHLNEIENSPGIAKSIVRDIVGDCKAEEAKYKNEDMNTRECENECRTPVMDTDTNTSYETVPESLEISRQGKQLTAPAEDDDNMRLICKTCGAYFVSAHFLRTHEESTHTYPCDICKSIFRTKNGLKIHVNNHHTAEKEAKRELMLKRKEEAEKSQVQCEICKKIKKSAKCLQRHMNKLHPPEYFECKAPNCGKRFEQARNLSQHMKCIHPAPLETEIICMICKAMNPPPPHCKISFTREAQFRQHCRRNHFQEAQELGLFKFKELGKTEVCHICGKTCVSEKWLEVHIQNFHPENGFVCHICAKSFSRRDGLRNHINSVHSTESFKCGKCPTILKSKIMLSKHMRNIHPIQPKPPQVKKYPCSSPECHQLFFSQLLARRHYERVHVLKPTNKCPQCPKMFKTLKDVETHLKSKFHADPNYRQTNKVQKHKLNINIKQNLSVSSKRRKVEQLEESSDSFDSLPSPRRSLRVIKKHF